MSSAPWPLAVLLFLGVKAGILTLVANPGSFQNEIDRWLGVLNLCSARKLSILAKPILQFLSFRGNC